MSRRKFGIIVVLLGFLILSVYTIQGSNGIRNINAAQETLKALQTAVVEQDMSALSDLSTGELRETLAKLDEQGAKTLFEDHLWQLTVVPVEELLIVPEDKKLHVPFHDPGGIPFEYEDDSLYFVLDREQGQWKVERLTYLSAAAIQEKRNQELPEKEREAKQARKMLEFFYQEVLSADQSEQYREHVDPSFYLDNPEANEAMKHGDLSDRSASNKLLPVYQAYFDPLRSIDPDEFQALDVGPPTSEDGMYDVTFRYETKEKYSSRQVNVRVSGQGDEFFVKVDARTGMRTFEPILFADESNEVVVQHLKALKTKDEALFDQTRNIRHEPNQTPKQQLQWRLHCDLHRHFTQQSVLEDFYVEVNEDFTEYTYFRTLPTATGLIQLEIPVYQENGEFVVGNATEKPIRFLGL